MSEVKNVTITVPVGLNGWQQEGSVVINGMKVEFPVGVETQVPETAAALLEKLIEEAKENAAEGSVGKYKQYVTDGNGNVAWEDRLAYKTTAEVVNLAPTELTRGDDDGFYLYSPWAVDIEAGKTYDVTYNGTKYACPALAHEQAGLTFCLLGNANLEGVDGGNPDAPFAMVCFPNSMQANDWPRLGILKPLDGATAVTIAVSNTIETVKTIDPKYLPENIVNEAPMIVTIDITTLTIDQPYANVYAALLAGKPVQIRAGADGDYNVLTLVKYNADYIGLVLNDWDDEHVAKYKIKSDGTVEMV